jgi:sRNA-binding protein
MSITGRLFGFALLGPIGAVGPTEASKRAKAQKKLLEEEAYHLQRMANAAERSVRRSAPSGAFGRYAAVTSNRRGDRVAAVSDIPVNRGGIATITAGEEGTVFEFRQGDVRVAWDAGIRVWAPTDYLVSLALVSDAPELPPLPVVSER